MVFSSLLFLFRFLPIVLLGYYIIPRRFRNFFLLITSLIFYAWGEPKFSLLMIASIVINYVGGRLAGEKKGRASRAVLIVTVALDIALLGFFKYTGFFLDNINFLFGSSLALRVLLPIGISFYTFQMMSYVIDVYRGKTEVQKSIVSFGCYVALFPQLIAGPIVQYKTVAEQLDTRVETPEKFASGALRFVVGLSKKVLLANQFGTLWDKVSLMDSPPALTAWLGIIAFTLQIYFDFSGYSDMAIGLGRMFGFEFLENFNYPYISKNITEFWRRWHISLGTWFREYVYIPLGGNRVSAVKHLRNILVVWLLTGIWHGASWNFVLWGLYFGLLLMIEKLFLLRALEHAPKVIRHLYALLFIVLGWGIFYFTDFSEMGSFMTSLFVVGEAGIISKQALAWVLGYLPWMILCAFASTPIGAHVAKRISNRRISSALAIVAGSLVFLLCVAALASQSYNPFIYFRF